MALITRDDNGNEVKHGDIIKDFRGDEWTFEHASRPKEDGKTGKVVVSQEYKGRKSTREYYDRVFSLNVTEDDS